jgi:hypothetical protein
MIMSPRFLPLSTNCWICEDWTCIKVAWDPNEQTKNFPDEPALDPRKIEPVYLHVELEDFAASLMNKNKETGEYELVRAVPLS